MWKVVRNERGSVAAITAAAFIVVLGMAGMVLDMGALYLHKIRLSNMVDAAVLASVRDLPEDKITAYTSAQNYASLNGQQAGDTLSIDFIGSDTIQVNATRNVNFALARIIGVNSRTASATAKAKVSVVSSATGVVPFGIVQQNFQYGQNYLLKLGPGSGYNGNFGALALGGTGANNYENNIKYGYPGKLEIVQNVPLLEYTETGNMSGPTSNGVEYRIGKDPTATFDTVQKNSPRIVIVPVIDSLDGNGRELVQIMGFAAFFLEGVGGSGNDNYVTGKFMRFFTDAGDSSGSAGDFGLRTIRLIN